MDLRSTQLKDTYGNLVTIGTTAGSPTTGTLENGQGADLTDITIQGTANATFKISSNRNDIILFENDTTDNNTLVRQQSNLLRFDTIADDLLTVTRRITLDHSSGDISFRDGSANEAFYWDASAGSLGIGTTSPGLSIYLDKVLTIGSTSSGQQGGLELLGNQSVNTVVSALTFNNQASGTADKRIAQISASRDGDDNSGLLSFNVWNGVDSSISAMRIDSSGNVGIGTNSPNSNYKTHIEAGSGNSTRLLVSTTDNADVAEVVIAHDEGLQGGLRLVSDKTNNIAKIRVTNSSQFPLAFDVRGSDGTNERMRITPGGNVGIGTTSPDTLLEIDGVSSYEHLKISSSSNTSRFMKIGMDDATNHTIEASGSGAFLTFKTGAVPTERVRILTTGGITFNGDTADANALDDYEEGTWTPVFVPQTGSFTTMTMDVQSASYTKIGNQVTVRAFFRTDNVDATGASGFLAVSGLPFTALSTNRNGLSAISVSSVLDWGTVPDGGFVLDDSITIRLQKTNATTALDVSDLTTGATSNKNQIILTATYFV